MSSMYIVHYGIWCIIFSGNEGMNKMVINHLEKLFVTKDAGTVIKELEVEHPAARMMVMATQMMEQEV